MNKETRPRQGMALVSRRYDAPARIAGAMSDLGGVGGQWAGNDTLLVEPPTP